MGVLHVAVLGWWSLAACLTCLCLYDTPCLPLQVSCYNYQSQASDPAVLLITATSKGTSVQVGL